MKRTAFLHWLYERNFITYTSCNIEQEKYESNILSVAIVESHKIRDAYYISTVSKGPLQTLWSILGDGANHIFFRPTGGWRGVMVNMIVFTFQEISWYSLDWVDLGAQVSEKNDPVQGGIPIYDHQTGRQAGRHASNCSFHTGV